MKFKINENLFKVTYEGKEGYVITTKRSTTKNLTWVYRNEEVFQLPDRSKGQQVAMVRWGLEVIASTFPLGDLPQFVIEHEFTEEDVRKAIDLARTGYGWEGNINVVDHLDNDGYSGCIDNFNKEFKFKTEEEIIQSLQKRKEITEIEFEMKYGLLTIKNINYA